MTRFIVDDLFDHGWRLGKSCHLMTDGTDEDLVQFAIGIGLKREWLQNAGTHKAHFDLVASKRALAIRSGAEEVDRYGLVELLNQKRAHLRVIAHVQAAPLNVLLQEIAAAKVKP